MDLTREGPVQIWENKTSPALAIRDTDYIYLLEVECLVGFLFLVVVVVVQCRGH